VPERGLQRVKLAMFWPPTRAIFRCKLEMQLEVNFEHAKRYVSGLKMHRETLKKIRQLGNK